MENKKTKSYLALGSLAVILAGVLVVGVIFFDPDFKSSSQASIKSLYSPQKNSENQAFFELFKEELTDNRQKEVSEPLYVPVQSSTLNENGEVTTETKIRTPEGNFITTEEYERLIKEGIIKL